MFGTEGFAQRPEICPWRSTWAAMDKNSSNIACEWGRGNQDEC